MAPHRGPARLIALYGTIEQMRSVEVRTAASAVEDVVCAASIATVLLEQQWSDARSAMATGDREEWQVAETARGVIEARILRMTQLTNERQSALNEATERHRETRVQQEQMQHVAERARAENTAREERQSQAESDDRYASRRAWMQRQTREVE